MHSRVSQSETIMMLMAWLLIAFILTIIPMPTWLVWWRPQWVYLLLLFWFTVLPQRIGIGWAFLIGLYVDLLTGTLFGQHAFVYSFVAYLVIKLHPRMGSLPQWQLICMVFLLSMLNLALQYLILGIAGHPPEEWSFWYCAISNSIIWPWLCILLRDSKWITQMVN